MEQSTTRASDPTDHDDRRSEDSLSPSVLGDVEDAVTPQAEGELPPWTPPDQPEAEEDRAD